MTLFGWDASDFDWSRGPMDLAAARAAGVDFFTHKATEGTSTKHVRYGEALNRARAAGIPFLGAYIVIRSGNVSAQVDYFLSYLDSQTSWWRGMPGFFLQVDLEHWPYDQVAPAQGVAACSLLRQRSGHWVVLYAPQWAYGNTIGGSDPLWASAYGGNPAVDFRQAYPGDGDGKRWQAYSGRTPVFLQYGSATTIGRQPGCDANAFRGSLADLRRLVIDGVDPGQVFPGNTPTASVEESDMPMYLLKTPTGHQYRGDGLWYAPIMTGAELDGWLNLVPPERRFEGVNLEWWGRDVTTVALAGSGGGAGPTLAQIQMAAGAAIDERLPAIADAVVDEDHRRSAD